MKQLHIFWVLSLLILGPFLLGQTTFYENTPDQKGSVAICAFDQTSMYNLPGRKGDVITDVLFGEELTHLGREATVKGEGPAYLLVETNGGAKGWISSGMVVRRGGLVVVLDRAPIYLRPSTSAAATNTFFEAGEMAILTDFSNNWIQLIGEDKNKEGWIQGYDRLSVNKNDLEVAGNIRVALFEKDEVNQREKLRRILSTRSEITPIMRSAVESRIQQTYPQGSGGNFGGTDYYDSNPSYTSDGYLPDQYQYYPGGEDAFAESNLNLAELGVSEVDLNNPVYRPNTSNYIEQEVVDATTGQSYLRVRQSGGIQPVKAKNPKTIYYAYHKSLPVGSEILLEIPSHPGKFVPLTVIAPLRPDNPNLVGLGAEVIQKVYGVEQASEVPYATIVFKKF